MCRVSGAHAVNSVCVWGLDEKPRFCVVAAEAGMGGRVWAQGGGARGVEGHAAPAEAAARDAPHGVSGHRHADRARADDGDGCAGAHPGGPHAVLPVCGCRARGVALTHCSTSLRACGAVGASMTSAVNEPATAEKSLGACDDRARSPFLSPLSLILAPWRRSIPARRGHGVVNAGKKVARTEKASEPSASERRSARARQGARDRAAGRILRELKRRLPGVRTQNHMDVLSTLSEELCEGLVVAMDGEKDPRCLLLAFEIWCGGVALPLARLRSYHLRHARHTRQKSAAAPLR